MGSVSFGFDENFENLTAPAPVSSAGSLVIAKFNEARAYSEALWNTAIQAMNELKGMSFEVALTDIVWDPIPIMGLDGINVAPPTQPDITPIAITWPVFSATDPNYYDIDIPAITIPGFNVADPGLSIPDPPLVGWPTLDSNPPEVSEAAIPTKPAVSIPPVPILSFASIPSPPEYNIPTFDA